MKLKLTILAIIVNLASFGQERHAFAMLFPEFDIQDLVDVKMVLEDEEFSFDQYNSIQGFFSTNPKTISKCPNYILGMQVQIEGFLENDGLYIYAIYKYNAKRKTGCSIGYSGQARRVSFKKAGCRIAYDELNRVAHIIGPDFIYIKN